MSTAGGYPRVEFGQVSPWAKSNPSACICEVHELSKLFAFFKMVEHINTYG